MSRTTTRSTRLNMAAAAICVVFALLAAAVPPGARADATALALLMLEAGEDQAGCGTIEAPCCVKIDGSTSCASPSLVCVPLSAQNLRCNSCGGAGQPVCAGGICNQGLIAINGPALPHPLCVHKPFTPPLPVPEGKSRAKEESDSGNARVGGCTKAGACLHSNEKCVNGVCVACGGRGEACCSASSDKPPCRSYGKVTPACVFDSKLKTDVCMVAA